MTGIVVLAAITPGRAAANPCGFPGFKGTRIATAFGFAGKLFNFAWSTVSRKSVHFERNFHIIEEFGSFLHNRKVAGATHNDADDWFHIFYAFFS